MKKNEYIWRHCYKSMVKTKFISKGTLLRLFMIVSVIAAAFWVDCTRDICEKHTETNESEGQKESTQVMAHVFVFTSLESGKTQTFRFGKQLFGCTIDKFVQKYHNQKMYCSESSCNSIKIPQCCVVCYLHLHQRFYPLPDDDPYLV